MAAPELSNSELAFLKKLNERNVRYLVVGLSAAALQGAFVVTQDVDLWFEDLHDPNLRAVLRECGASYVPPFELNPPMFAGGGLQLLDIVLRMDGLEHFAKEFAGRVELPYREARLPMLPLNRILASKKAANRPKDQLAIKVIEDAIKTF